ncbi:hypothetical protein EMIT0232MI5_150164 [Pseudomonas sp. IT-232MI5]
MPMRGRVSRDEVTVGAPSRASSLPHLDRVQSARNWSAPRPPSRAGSLLQGIEYIRKKQVGSQAAIAGKPAPTGIESNRQTNIASASHHSTQ